MSNQIIQFTNVRLVRNGLLHENVDLWIKNGKVIDPQTLFFEQKQKADQVIDGHGQIIAPGFIDIQINGQH